MQNGIQNLYTDDNTQSSGNFLFSKKKLVTFIHTFIEQEMTLALPIHV